MILIMFSSIKVWLARSFALWVSIVWRRAHAEGSV